VDFSGALRLLGERIRVARKAKGLSQEELALEAGIDRSFMGQVERGQRNVSVLTLYKLAAVIGVDVGSFFGTAMLPPQPARPRNPRHRHRSTPDAAADHPPDHS
jgi:transcriptional regulator with XRE-family HTH domain